MKIKYPLLSRQNQCLRKREPFSATKILGRMIRRKSLQRVFYLFSNNLMFFLTNYPIRNAIMLRAALNSQVIWRLATDFFTNRFCDRYAVCWVCRRVCNIEQQVEIICIGNSRLGSSDACAACEIVYSRTSLVTQILTMQGFTLGFARVFGFRCILLGIVEFWRELAIKYWNRRQREWADDLIKRTYETKELMRRLTI